MNTARIKIKYIEKAKKELKNVKKLKIKIKKIKKLTIKMLFIAIYTKTIYNIVTQWIHGVKFSNLTFL
jgi:hypothetical protein